MSIPPEIAWLSSPIKGVVRNHKLSRLMLLGTNVAINIDISCNASVALTELLAGPSDAVLFPTLTIPRLAFAFIFRDFKKPSITG